MGGVHPAQPEHPSCVDAVRIVFASAPAFGHVNPMLALARAFVDGDDDVVMATSPEMGARAEAAGIHAVQAGSNMSVWWAELTRRTGGAPGDGTFDFFLFSPGLPATDRRPGALGARRRPRDL